MASAYDAAPLIHAGFRGPLRACSSFEITSAIAPSDDGHVSRYRMGSHSIGEFITSSTVIGSVRCAYSFRPALSRAFAAIIGPMCAGAFVFAMYARQYGAKNPPAPATSGGVKGIDGESAHIALPSDCFSNATVRTR